MKIRCLAGVLGPVGLLTAVTAVATAAPGQLPRLPAPPSAGAVSAGESVESVVSDSVVVLPFTNISRNERDDWLGDGIAETVAADLETRDVFAVVARERVAAATRGRGAANKESGTAVCSSRVKLQDREKGEGKP
jgi:hypothetical protein